MKLPIRLPQVLALLFATFLSIFAADVFEGGQFSLSTFVALVIHLIPSFLVLLLAWLGRRFPLPAAVCFCLLGIGYILITMGRFTAMTKLIIGGPPIAIGLLYLKSYFKGTC